MVIARFSLAWLLIFLLGIGFMTGLGVWTAYQEGLRSVFTWFFFFAGPLFILNFLYLLAALLFHRCRAMWLENGELVFLPYGLPATFTSFLYRVPVDCIQGATIERLYTGSFLRPRGIVIDRKDRGFNRPYGEAPAHIYSEPVEVVLTRLNQVLGLAPVTSRVADAPPNVLDGWRS